MYKINSYSGYFYVHCSNTGTLLIQKSFKYWDDAKSEADELINKSFDINDVLLFIHTFSDSYFSANFKSLEIEKAKTIVLNKFSQQSDKLNNTINIYQFEAVKKNIKDQIRKELLK